MSNDDPLLDQADTLMRRHRVFVAGAQAEDELAPGPKQGGDFGNNGDQDDLPLLTEEVDAEPVPPAEVLETLARAQDHQLLAERQAALASEMETWLDEQLPQVVISAMDDITDRLVALITQRAREELLPRLDAMLEPAEDGVRQGDSDRPG